MGSFDTRVPRVSLERFHAFRDERPEEKKWELIDGVLVMMPPPTLVHQRIAKNLEALLTAALAIAKLTTFAVNACAFANLPDKARCTV
jgi:Uma2 family endonuclease